MYAPGLPSKSNISEVPVLTKYTADIVIQEHKADRAGLHYDLRLGINGIGYSWAGRRLPEIGEKVLMVRQPDHTISYFDFSGEITDGYGKGTVSTFLRDKAEIVESSPRKITFYVYSGTSVKKYSLVNSGGDQWLFINHTLSGDVLRELNSIKPLKYKDKSGRYFKKLETDIETPKIDGANSVTILRPNKNPVVFGKRVSSKTGLPIEYTPKIESVYAKKSPVAFGNTVLRTEVFALTPDNKEVPNRVLGGMLNSNVWKSREFQNKNNTPLQLAAFDIIKYKNKDVSDLPYARKVELIRNISETFPHIKYISDVPSTFSEGSIVWRNNTPIKLKNKQDYDVFVRDIFSANTSNTPRAGGFEYALTKDGPIVGRVGTGFLHKELKDMLTHKDNYIGRVAKVYAQEQHPSGALRAPSFNTWHLDK